MGATCGCMKDQKVGGLELDANLGEKEDGVTEEYQYHPNHIDEHKLKLNLWDKFYREIMCPLHLYNHIQFFDAIETMINKYQLLYKSDIDQDYVNLAIFHNYLKGHRHFHLWTNNELHFAKFLQTAQEYGFIQHKKKEELQDDNESEDEDESQKSEVVNTKGQYRSNRIGQSLIQVNHINENGPFAHEIDLTEKNIEMKDLVISLFDLRLLGLLVCRGEHKEKANAFYKLCVADLTQSDSETDQIKLTWSNKNLQRSIKFFIFISHILPKKFMLQYLQDPLYETVCFHSEKEYQTVNSRTSRAGKRLVQEQKDDPQWSQDLQTKEQEGFEEICKQILDNEIIERLFSGNQAACFKAKYLETICKSESMFGNIGDLNVNFMKKVLPCEKEVDYDQVPLLWLFSTKHIRNLIRKRTGSAFIEKTTKFDQ